MGVRECIFEGAPTGIAAVVAGRELARNLLTAPPLALLQEKVASAAAHWAVVAPVDAQGPVSRVRRKEVVR